MLLRSKTLPGLLAAGIAVLLSSDARALVQVSADAGVDFAVEYPDDVFLSGSVGILSPLDVWIAAAL